MERKLILVELERLAETGQTDEMQKIWDEATFDREYASVCIYGAAIRHRNLRLLRWIYQRDPSHHHSDVTCAVIWGALRLLKWMKRRGFDFEGADYPCATALRYKRREVFEWLKKVGYGKPEWDYRRLRKRVKHLHWTTPSKKIQAVIDAEYPR